MPESTKPQDAQAALADVGRPPAGDGPGGGHRPDARDGPGDDDGRGGRARVPARCGGAAARRTGPASGRAGLAGFVSSTAKKNGAAGQLPDDDVLLWAGVECGAEFWIVPDNDPPGRKAGAILARRLQQLRPGIPVRWVDPSKLVEAPANGWDLADWIDPPADAAERRRRRLRPRRNLQATELRRCRSMSSALRTSRPRARPTSRTSCLRPDDRRAEPVQHLYYVHFGANPQTTGCAWGVVENRRRRTAQISGRVGLCFTCFYWS